MKKLTATGLILSMTAMAAQAQEFTGSIYIEDATIEQGKTATLSVQLNNNIEIRGFEFMLTLPQGINYDNWNLSANRLPNGATIKQEAEGPDMILSHIGIHKSSLSSVVNIVRKANGTCEKIGLN